MRFTPSLFTPAHTRIDIKDAIFNVKDGGSNELQIKIAEGNFVHSERREMEYYPDRGNLDDVNEGDQVPMEVRFEFVWEYIRSTSTGSTPTVEDALKQRGGAADWVSSDSDTCRPYSVDLELVHTPDCTTGDIETLTFADFRWESLEHDPRTGQISCTGKCNATEPTSVRTAQ